MKKAKKRRAMPPPKKQSLQFIVRVHVVDHVEIVVMLCHKVVAGGRGDHWTNKWYQSFGLPVTGDRSGARSWRAHRCVHARQKAGVSVLPHILTVSRRQGGLAGVARVSVNGPRSSSSTSLAKNFPVLIKTNYYDGRRSCT
jgi:hypothetical protein